MLPAGLVIMQLEQAADAAMKPAAETPARRKAVTARQPQPASRRARAALEPDDGMDTGGNDADDEAAAPARKAAARAGKHRAGSPVAGPPGAAPEAGLGLGSGLQPLPDLPPGLLAAFQPAQGGPAGEGGTQPGPSSGFVSLPDLPVAATTPATLDLAAPATAAKAAKCAPFAAPLDRGVAVTMLTYFSTVRAAFSRDALYVGDEAVLSPPWGLCSTESMYITRLDDSAFLMHSSLLISRDFWSSELQH